MQYSRHQLVLFPTSSETTPLTPSALHTCLRKLGLLGETLGKGYYTTGKDFLSLLCFLGCSPDIELKPHPDKVFCYVQLPENETALDLHLIRKPTLNVTNWVIIGNIHEAEAVPDATLLSALEAASGERWKYAYRLLADGAVCSTVLSAGTAL
ncbi:hypothetical protein RCF98_10600 [Thiothrix lacustris]|uniref:Uncharacterized protein n=1 Tax=Thiothrix lacustris TaxID=525917 RepID=A0ABY9MPW4_9GAMM|nr:hypothetical protein [Thiothrix lacustris]WML89420.1 hypothetical protein RCF98_10600 [Thiothrix lacustris]